MLPIQTDVGFERALGTFVFPSAFGVYMMHFTSNDSKANVVGRIGSQPIALAAAALVILVVGVGSVILWRAYTGTSPEKDRIPSAPQLQPRTPQASAQLIQKTKRLRAPHQAP